MLEPTEKAYYRALRALENKQYQQAVGYFDQAAGLFEGNQEFDLLRETTGLMVELKQALATAEKTDKADEETLIIEETFTDGQETNLP
jgi:hypothetical protein